MSYAKYSPGGCECCDCKWTIVISSCEESAISGASVTVTKDGVVVYSGTTDIDGSVTILNIPIGFYKISVGPIGPYSAMSVTVNHGACNQTTSIYLSRTDGAHCDGPRTFCFTVDGCTGGIPFQPVEVVGPNDFATAGTTDSTGQFCFTGPDDGLYTFTISPTSSKFQGKTVTLHYDSVLNNQGTQLSASDGYICTCCCNYPWPESMHFTVNDLSVSLAYQGDGVWAGCGRKTIQSVLCPPNDTPQLLCSKCHYEGFGYTPDFCYCGYQTGEDGNCGTTVPDPPIGNKICWNDPATDVSVAVRLQCTGYGVGCRRAPFDPNPTGASIGLFPSCCGFNYTTGRCDGIDVWPSYCPGGLDYGVFIPIDIGAQCEVVDFSFDFIYTISVPFPPFTIEWCTCFYGPAGTHVSGSLTE